MNAPDKHASLAAPLDFIDLKSQYAALRDNINARMQRVLDHGQYIMGPEVAELEKHLAAHTGARHCITVASGTEALLITLMALELKPGDEVITTPFTFAATAEMIVLAGAVPVFVDIEADTCNIDASLIEAAITPRTRAIMPVSLYGQVADMDEINAIAARHGLAVIEDAAQSFGASYKGRKSCNLSTFGCTSFFPEQAAGLLRRRRRHLHQRRQARPGLPRNPRARPERALPAHARGRGRAHGHAAVRRGAGQA